MTKTQLLGLSPIRKSDEGGASVFGLGWDFLRGCVERVHFFAAGITSIRKTMCETGCNRMSDRFRLRKKIMFECYSTSGSSLLVVERGTTTWSAHSRRCTAPLEFYHIESQTLTRPDSEAPFFECFLLSSSPKLCYTIFPV